MTTTRGETLDGVSTRASWRPSPPGRRAAEPSPAKRRRRRRQILEGYLFVAPIALGILLFQGAPIVVSVYTSFTQWDGIGPARFIGLENFKELLSGADPIFTTVLRNTLIFTVASVPLTIALAIPLAMICNLKFRGSAFFRTAFFTPYVMNAVAIGFVWFYLYSPSGILNSVLGTVGIHGPAWLADSKWVIIALVIVSVWQGVGYPMVILLAGLQAIPETLYETAKLDGAKALARTRLITLPLLSPQIFFVLIAQFIASFQVFGLIYVMTRGGPGYSSSVYIYYLWQSAFSLGRMGYAAAMAWLVVVIIAAVTWVQWRLQKRWVFYG